MGWKVIGLLLAALLAFGPWAMSTSTTAQEPPTVSVMFDFGTGRVLQTSLSLPVNSTAWNATEAAAESLGLRLNVTWFGSDVFVNDIGDTGAAYPDWWHFLVWDWAEVSWSLASMGPAAMVLWPGASIGWFLARDDPSWQFTSPWLGPQPDAIPSHPYPVQMFRYDATGTGVAPQAGPSDPELFWSYDTKAFEITGSPAMSNDVLFLPTWTGLVSLYTSSSFRWVKPEVAGASSPTIYDGRLYVGARDGRLHVLDKWSGDELWNMTLQISPQFSGITASPRIAYGKVYLGTFNESGGDGTFYAIDLFTHAVVWSRAVSSVHLSSAAIVNRTVIVGLAGRFRPGDLAYDPPYGVLALDAETGMERWFVASNGSVASSPAVLSDVVYATTKAGELFAIRLDGLVQWKKTIDPTIASPAVAKNRIIVGDGLLGSTGSLRAFDTAGNLLWSHALSGPVSASPTIAGDLVYAATNEPAGRVLALRLTNGTEAWSQILEPHEYILSSPVVYEGVLYIASDNGILYAFIQRNSMGAGGDIFLFGAAALGAITTAIVLVAAWIVARRKRRHA